MAPVRWLSFCFFLLPACGATARAPEPEPIEPDAARHAFTELGERREVGDYSVTRFSGSARSAPLVLTERVVGAEGDAMVVEFIFESNGSSEVLRARMKAGRLGEVLGVTRVVDGREVPVPVETYDRMMAELAFFPDETDERLGEETLTCLVGSRELDCTKSSYKVRIGGRAAVLSIVTTEDLGGRDVEGEVRTDDGEMVYRVQLVETGRERASKATARASE